MRFFFRVLPVDECHVADTLHQLGAGVAAELLNDAGAPLSVTDPHFNLDEFMMQECRFEFGSDGGSQAGIAYADNRLELMPEAAKEFFLLIAEIHLASVSVP